MSSGTPRSRCEVLALTGSIAGAAALAGCLDGVVGSAQEETDETGGETPDCEDPAGLVTVERDESVDEALSTVAGALESFAAAPVEEATVDADGTERATAI